MGMVQTCFKQVWANSRHFTVHTLLSHVALLVSFPFQFNAVEVQQKREKKAASLAWAAQQMPLWTWDLMRKQATKPGEHAINQRKMEVSKVYLCKKQRYGMRHKCRWERNLMTCRYFGRENPYRNSQREDLIPFNVTQRGPCISSLSQPRWNFATFWPIFNFSISRSKGLAMWTNCCWDVVENNCCWCKQLIGVHSCYKPGSWNHQ